MSDFGKTQGKVNPHGHPCDSETRNRANSRRFLRKSLHKSGRKQDRLELVADLSTPEGEGPDAWDSFMADEASYSEECLNWEREMAYYDDYEQDWLDEFGDVS